MEDKNVERSVDGGGLACEIPEGHQDSLREVYAIFCIKNMWNETFTLWEELILVIWG